MRCMKEVARITYTYFLPSRLTQVDRANANSVATRDLGNVLAQLPSGERPSEIDDTRQQPIFLLSAGWRSGSTLLQRLVCSDPSVLVWGEPYDLCHATERLIASLRPFTEDWPKPGFFIDAKNDGELAEQWIANLYPPLESVREAHERFFLTLFAEAGERRGFTRWGLKEVRYGRDQIQYLRWLFPGARFVLLVRNPEDCWRSYRGKGWFWRWPDQPVRTARCFARNWTRLAGDFLHESEANDTYLVRYEDLNLPDTLKELSQHLNMPIASDALKNRIGGGVKPARRGCRVAEKLESVIIRREARAVAPQLGYG